MTSTGRRVSNDLATTSGRHYTGSECFRVYMKGQCMTCLVQ